MKKLLFFISIFVTFIFALNSCKKTNHENKSNKQSTVRSTEKQYVFTHEDIARFAISAIMGRSPKTMECKKKNNVYYVSYIRPSDSQKFEYRIKFNGNKIYWASLEGRWRDSLDENISFIQNGNNIKIIQSFSDGSFINEEYKTTDL